MRKQILALGLAALLLTPMSVRAEEKIALSGTYQGLEWKLKHHLLTISGTGEIQCKPSIFPDDNSVDTLNWQPYEKDVYEIVIGEGVTGAQNFALAEYPNLQKITLPSTFKSLSAYALSDNPALTEINGLEYVTDFNFHCLSNTPYIQAHPYIITDRKLYYAECAGNTELTVPDGVTEIMPFAFGNLIDEYYMPSNEGSCEGVHVILPDSVEMIRENAFALCAGMKSVHMPANLREIGDCAFYSCAGLDSLTLGEQVERIGNQAFYNCRSLETLTVQNPDTVWGENVYGTCYDWDAVAADQSAERENLDDLDRIRSILQKSPTAMDEMMAVFALHFFDTCDYCNISLRDDFEHIQYHKKQGTVSGWKHSTAQRYAEDNSLRFEVLDAAPGDVNTDGVIDILDVIALNRYLIGVSSPKAESRAAADYNDDGRITAEDSIEILRHVLEIQ